MKLRVTDDGGNVELLDGTPALAGLKAGDEIMVLQTSLGLKILDLRDLDDVDIRIDPRTGLPVLHPKNPPSQPPGDLREALDEMYEERARQHAGLDNEV